MGEWEGRVKSVLGWCAVLIFGAVLMGVFWRAREEGAGVAYWEGAEPSAPAVLRVGYAVQEPYAMVAAGGSPAGAIPELAGLIANRMGVVRVEWRLTEFGQLLDELDQGLIDVVAAGMFVTPQRQQRALFSAPTFAVGPGLLVQAGNPRGFLGYAELVAAAGARAAVVAGTVEGPDLLKAGLPEERLVVAPDAQSALVLLRAGRVDAVALSVPSLRWLARDDEALEVVSVPPGGGGYSGVFAFAFQADERGLKAQWDRAQRRVLAEPIYADLARRHRLDPLTTVTEVGP